MSMLTLNGTIANIYQSQKGVNRETGEEYGGQQRIQLMCQNTLKNGQTRMELVDLSVDDVKLYKDHGGKPVSVPVGVYVAGGKAQFYALKTQTATA